MVTPIREVVFHDLTDGDEVIAQLWVDDGTLHHRWIEPDAAESLLGEISGPDGTLTPGDGVAYFDALPGAFSNASLVSVRDLTHG